MIYFVPQDLIIQGFNLLYFSFLLLVSLLQQLYKGVVIWESLKPLLGLYLAPVLGNEKPFEKLDACSFCFPTRFFEILHSIYGKFQQIIIPLEGLCIL